MEGPEPIGALIVPSVRLEMEEQKAGLYEDVHDKILRACPEYATSWALEFVCDLVAMGRVPKRQVLKALDRYTRQLELAREAKRRPILDPASYLSGILIPIVGDCGVAWRRPQERRANKSA